MKTRRYIFPPTIAAALEGGVLNVCVYVCLCLCSSTCVTVKVLVCVECGCGEEAENAPVSTKCILGHA